MTNTVSTRGATAFWSFAALALTLILCWPLVAIAADPPQPLTFAWPDGLRGVVTVTKEQVRDGRAPSRMTNRYVMTGSKRTGGYRVEFGDFQFDVDNNFGMLPDAQRAQMVLLLQSAFPTYLINDAGELEALHDVEDFVAKLRKQYEQLGSTASEAERTTRGRVLDTIFTSGVMLTIAQQEWNRMVGMWLGAPLQVGQEYRLDSKAALPVPSGRQITIRGTFKAVSKQRCERSDVVRSCLVIEYQAQPDPADVSAALTEFVEKAGGAAASSAKSFQSALSALKINQWFRLVTEPDTLIPHELHIKALGSVDAGSTQQETWMQFRYPAPAH